ncbi:MAG: hypothetical protein Q4E61_03235, partial [Alphaproteobacteria bacterium]|nr:hypothetical protein [Alphaproteobacteria bacterium]
MPSSQSNNNIDLIKKDNNQPTSIFSNSGNGNGNEVIDSEDFTDSNFAKFIEAKGFFDKSFEKCKNTIINLKNEYEINAFTKKKKIEKVKNDFSNEIKSGYAEGQKSSSPSKDAEKLEHDFTDGIEKGVESDSSKMHDLGKSSAENFKKGFEENNETTLSSGTEQTTTALSQEGKVGETAGEQIAEGMNSADKSVQNVITSIKNLLELFSSFNNKEIEYASAINLLNGFSAEINKGSIGSSSISEILTNNKGKINTGIHTHGTYDYAGFSSKDLESMSVTIKDGITYQILATVKELEVLDLSGLDSDTILKIKNTFSELTDKWINEIAMSFKVQDLDAVFKRIGFGDITNNKSTFWNTVLNGVSTDYSMFDKLDGVDSFDLKNKIFGNISNFANSLDFNSLLNSSMQEIYDIISKNLSDIVTNTVTSQTSGENELLTVLNVVDEFIKNYLDGLKRSLIDVGHSASSEAIGNNKNLANKELELFKQAFRDNGISDIDSRVHILQLEQMDELLPSIISKLHEQAKAQADVNAQSNKSDILTAKNSESNIEALTKEAEAWENLAKAESDEKAIRYSSTTQMTEKENANVMNAFAEAQINLLKKENANIEENGQKSIEISKELYEKLIDLKDISDDFSIFDSETIDYDILERLENTLFALSKEDLLNLGFDDKVIEKYLHYLEEVKERFQETIQFEENPYGDESYIPSGEINYNDYDSSTISGLGEKYDKSAIFVDKLLNELFDIDLSEYEKKYDVIEEETNAVEEQVDAYNSLTDAKEK